MGLSFAADWLALREPFDHAARAAEVTDATMAHMAGLPSPLIVDLGCGRGSNLRFLRAKVPAASGWRLIDHDADLLAEAAKYLSDTAVECRLLDLRHAELTGALAGADLVTAAALIDLVSSAWLERLVDAVDAAGAALLVTGSIDGRVAWQPNLADDAAVLAAYAQHQAGDKGFGGALGTRGPGMLEDILHRQQWRVVKGQGDWREIRDPSFQAAYLRGVEAALHDAGFHRDPLDRWLDQRWDAIRRGTSQLTVGHLDIFAAPPTQSSINPT